MTRRLTLAILALLCGATPLLSQPVTMPQTGHAAILPLAEVAEVIAYSSGGSYKVTGDPSGHFELYAQGSQLNSWVSRCGRDFPKTDAVAALAVNDRGTLAAGSTAGMIEIFTPAADKWERSYWESLARDQAITAMVLSETDYLAIGDASGAYYLYQRKFDGNEWAWTSRVSDHLASGAITAITVTEGGEMAVGSSDGSWEYWFPDAADDSYWYMTWDPSGNGITGVILDDSGMMGIARNDGVLWVYDRSGTTPEDITWASLLNWQLPEGQHATTLALAKGTLASCGTDQGRVELFRRDPNPADPADPWTNILIEDFPGQDPVIEVKFLPGPKLEARSSSGAIWRWGPNAKGDWKLLPEGTIELSE
ncbi:MAG: hypothetical protein ABI743_13800 [bacterium]